MKYWLLFRVRRISGHLAKVRVTCEIQSGEFGISIVDTFY